jgi:hypothetical protein
MTSRIGIKGILSDHPVHLRDHLTNLPTASLHPEIDPLPFGTGCRRTDDLPDFGPRNAFLHKRLSEKTELFQLLSYIDQVVYLPVAESGCSFPVMKGGGISEFLPQPSPVDLCEVEREHVFRSMVHPQRRMEPPVHLATAE